MTLTPAELAAMPHITPTGFAEAGYQARKAAKHAARVAAAAGGLPPSDAVFRPTIEGKLLMRLARAAYEQHAAAAIADDERAAMAAALLPLIEERFPPADMAVLHRYGLAAEQRSVMVEATAVYVLRLPTRPFSTPRRGVPHFSTFAPDTRETAPLPDEFRPAVERWLEAQKRKNEIMLAVGWPSRFKATHKRWPEWGEIERAWPLIADQMTLERSV